MKSLLFLLIPFFSGSQNFILSGNIYYEDSVICDVIEQGIDSAIETHKFLHTYSLSFNSDKDYVLLFKNLKGKKHDVVFVKVLGEGKYHFDVDCDFSTVYMIRNDSIIHTGPYWKMRLDDGELREGD